MSKPLEERVSYALGLLDGTLGSPRQYDESDLRRRMQIITKVLRGEDFSELAKEDKERQELFDFQPRSQQ